MSRFVAEATRTTADASRLTADPRRHRIDLDPMLAPGAALASPFQRLAALIAGVPPGRPAIDLSIGEPRHPVPDMVAAVLAAANADFGRYPPIRGTDAFRAAVAAWLERRFGLSTPIDRADGVIPLNGSREGLFYAAVHAIAEKRADGEKPVVLVPNPFYAVYAAGAAAAGAETVTLPAGPETGFLPDLSAVDPALLDRAVALYFASPANPQGAVADLATWTTVVETCRRHGIMLFADECYSEIWRGDPPPGVLFAADRLGEGYAGIVAFNSLSKRSNLPGLRCGFAAGDASFLSGLARFRNVAAPQVPLPVQAVAVAVLADEAHVIENRRLYDLKFATAERRLGARFGAVTPPGGFFLWLDVAHAGGGEAAASKLWREAGVKTVPGAYLAVTDEAGRNPGTAYLRVAMVDDLDRTDEAMARIAEVLS